MPNLLAMLSRSFLSGFMTLIFWFLVIMVPVAFVKGAIEGIKIRGEREKRERGW